ncbi:MAG: hypothetical protein LBV59_24070 [Sphingobacterium sp.]|uniref:hypothetical protein n=1 Tax=Sphingobacterium sp. TaxID=341027 RepID=UPI002847532A|nr:hypothetical protein [Sphingobacterium sp.]MDR3011024.1 hypothetical protein [Sphingobacterium sp.]
MGCRTKTGTVAGSVEPGGSTILGGFIGGLISGAAGYFSGRTAGVTVYDKVITKGVELENK